LKFALEAIEETVASGVGIPDLSHIAIGRSLMALGPGIWVAKEWILLFLYKHKVSFSLETEFSFDCDRGATLG
jgi:hypothetical protein